MIERITKNKDNLGEPDLEPIEKIVEKLNYYRSLFGKIQDLTDEEFENLKNDISKFFTLKVGSNTDKPPKRLVRISNNNRILEAQGKELSYLTHISQLLAPPIDYCNFGRCNIPKQQVLYCATSEAGAYWEIKPQNGDVITISHFELKPNTKVNSFIVKKELTKKPEIKSKLHEVYYLLEEFFEEIYSLRISRDRPRDYLFTGQISSDQLFYPVVSELNFDAILYPSVQRKKHGWNVAIRNELILERYNLIGVETRFILDEYDNLDHTSEEVTTDQVIGSFGTEAFDFENGKILYDEEKANKAFEIFRTLQVGGGKQVRNEEEGLPKNLLFNCTPQNHKKETEVSPSRKLGRNDRINVVYQNGKRMDNIKYKKVQSDVEQGKCRITKY
ncbi:RES domain-containing protein [Flavobacterium sp. RSSB_23]|uniref:RES domain-containing protein n=1 Tax=Flavobacterium sp. RSSB_23 TaxID=3447668 RepID=UPI003F3B0D07